MNRASGIILIVVGIVIGLIAAAWVFTNEGLQPAARILTLGLALLVIVAPLVGGGIYLTVQGTGEAKQQYDAALQRKLLNIIQSRGSVPIDDVALEMQQPKDAIRDMLYSLVGLGLYSGYINWDK